MSLINLFAVITIIASAASVGSSPTDGWDEVLKLLCNDTDNPNKCWDEIIVAHYDKFNHTEDRVRATISALDLARAKAIEIQQQIKKLYTTCDAENQLLKDKYMLCVNNYNDVISDIDNGKTYINTPGIWYTATPPGDIILDDFAKCVHSFDIWAADLNQVRDMNNEMKVYAQLVRASIFNTIVT